MNTKTRHILAVCTGNVCRSPLAEYLLRKHLAPYPEWTVSSAGVFAGNGQPASPESVEVLAEQGIDASAHRSRMLTRELLDGADYVLVMTQSHRHTILAQWPDVADKVHLITSFAVAGATQDEIADPIGQSTAVYRRTRDQIEAAIADFLLVLVEKDEITPTS